MTAAPAKHTNLTENFDRNVEVYQWSPDSKTIYFQTEDKAEMPIYSIAAAPEVRRRIVAGQFQR